MIDYYPGGSGLCRAVRGVMPWYLPWRTSGCTYVAQGSPGCLRPSARRIEGSFRVDRNLTKLRQVRVHKYGLGLTRYLPGSLSG